MVEIVNNRNCVYQTAYHVIWCPKYRRDVLSGEVASATGAMLETICMERGWPVISKEIQPDRFVCKKCGLRAHADLNASRNLARIGESADSPRANVNTPDVGDMGSDVHVSP
jgi:hypothetical protein